MRGGLTNSAGAMSSSSALAGVRSMVKLEAFSCGANQGQKDANREHLVASPAA